MITAEIDKFLKTSPRNRVIISKTSLPGLKYVDIGKTMAEALFSENGNRRISLYAQETLESLLDKAIIRHEHIGNVLAITNLGILFEPALKIDFNFILENYSKNNTLIIQWAGEFDQHHLYFLSKENGITLIIDNLSHIII